MEEWKCKACEAVKPITEFNLVGDRWGSRRHECKSCESTRKKLWYNQNIERVRAQQAEKRKEVKGYRDPDVKKRNAEYQKRYREKLKAEIYAAYGNRCACCGETEVKFLSIDHVKNDGYEIRKAGFDNCKLTLMGRIKREGFPPDFQILCMNCNHGKSRNNGVCPHKEGSTTRA